MPLRPRHPMQPVEWAPDNVIRFRPNEIVKYLLAVGSMDLNKLALLPFTNEDREQFAQLLGYSITGFSELDYVSDDVFHAADKAARALLIRVPPRPKKTRSGT